MAPKKTRRRAQLAESSGSEPEAWTVVNPERLSAGAEDGQVVADAPVPKARSKRLLNKPLPRLVEPPTPVADITRALLSLVYWRISRDEDQEKQDDSSAEEPSEEEDDYQAHRQMQWQHWRGWQHFHYKEQWQHWRSNPVEDAWKERCCCIRHGFSGNELAVIPRKKLRELENCRNVYRRVRELLQLRKHISLALYFAECPWRQFSTFQWRRHEVRCGDRYMGSYLEGAVLEAVTHP